MLATKWSNSNPHPQLVVSSLWKTCDIQIGPPLWPINGHTETCAHVHQDISIKIFSSEYFRYDKKGREEAAPLLSLNRMDK